MRRQIANKARSVELAIIISYSTSATGINAPKILGRSSNKFLVSKETVVLRRWERSKQKFGFIKRVDKG